MIIIWMLLRTFGLKIYIYIRIVSISKDRPSRNWRREREREQEYLKLCVLKIQYVLYIFIYDDAAAFKFFHFDVCLFICLRGKTVLITFEFPNWIQLKSHFFSTSKHLHRLCLHFNFCVSVDNFLSVSISVSFSFSNDFRFSCCRFLLHSQWWSWYSIQWMNLTCPKIT